jgi:isoleucyl-tRNA synthetase
MTATTDKHDDKHDDKQGANAAPKGDYRRTLNITLSDKDPGAFPQRGNLPAREPAFQARWEAMDLYGLSLRKPAPLGTYVLHDGPPYSNGDIHLGHALNKVAKDIVTRYKTMRGYCAPYVPGWDNHGMPIENAVARKFRERKQAPDRVTLRQACREYAAEWVRVQRDQFKRLGIRGNWEKPYLTMNADFEAKIVEVFGELAAQGFIYRGLKPVFWCATCETALADAEVEYEPHTSNSIYVRFPLYHDPNGVFALPDVAPVTEGQTGEGVPAYVVIWTTTPWTIPANLAVAVHPDADYAVVRATKNEETVYYLVAVPLVEATMQVAGVTQYTTVKTVHGDALAGLAFRHPLFKRTSPVVLADYVTMDTGTGIVHTAPGHGKEDFETGVKYGLEVLNPVDNSGRYTAQAGEYDGQSFQGLRVTTLGDKKGQDAEANGVLIEALRKSGNLLSASRFEHSYPHCWRCHSPLIFRATVQWFMNIDHRVSGQVETGQEVAEEPFRQRALKAVEDVTWYPKESINRITSMVANRPDWCVSRQRSWGVGIPAFYCNHCGEHILTPESVAAVAALVRSESSDAWYARSAAEVLPPGFQCPHCHSDVGQLRKETDVLDVWFDSGSTNRAVLEATTIWPELRWPADLYLEGGDQHRGWFNSSLMIGVGTKGRAPYKAVVTNGWTLDENGEAFSKSKGNGVNPLDVVKNYGADVVRWWVVSQNFMEDTRCGENLLKQVGEMYRRVRNTFRFLVNNLYDFDPATDAVPQAEMEELDQWALVQLGELVRSCTAAYESFEFHKVYQQVLNFCAVELSAFYLDVLKDRLYASGAQSRERRSAQTAMHTLAETLARLLAPILIHTAEEVWDHLKMPNKPASVHLADFPSADTLPTEVPAFWDELVVSRDLVKSALELARQAGTIGNPLEACVELNLGKTNYALFQPYATQLQALFLVSQVRLSDSFDGENGVSVRAVPAEGVKCARCWLIKTDVGVDAEYPDLCARCAGVLKG